MLEQAASIYQAESVPQARARLAMWAETWGGLAPESVATLERDFEQTIAYHALEGPVRPCLRATSLLERTNRELRRKFRQAVTFGSPVGAEAAIYLQVRRLHACWSDNSWWEVSHSPLFAL